ncbi:hypothetical protein D9757_014830 [Collybiopsis confluens]|uniref:Uncharacterized protein n=1 Tax=Collybiopsis confluens TaxID=2823264 RepID=A0A8H5GEB2_9AGAR|nr:hypothetical protein D9757_014830 [Collybiopsis confluens]
MFHLDKNVDEMGLLDLVSLLPLSTSTSTMILIDSYDAPLEGAAPADVDSIEAIIRQVLYSSVLANFGDCSDSSPTYVIIMGTGATHNPQMLAGYANIEDYSNAEDFATAIGFTADDIENIVIPHAAVPSENRAALLENILTGCEPERFAKDCKEGIVYNSQEVVTRVIRLFSLAYHTV